nr:hypothetical protein [Tanacetum cinerariifolium]
MDHLMITYNQESYMLAGRSMKMLLATHWDEMKKRKETAGCKPVQKLRRKSASAPTDSIYFSSLDDHNPRNA